MSYGNAILGGSSIFFNFDSLRAGGICVFLSKWSSSIDSIASYCLSRIRHSWRATPDILDADGLLANSSI